MADERTAVLVVGAGLAGSATTLFLANRGVDVLLVERQASGSIHPRVTGQSQRTMELLRIGGVRIPTAPADHDVSPADRGAAPQDHLEHTLRTAAEQAGATIRFSSEVIDIHQDPTGVTARVLNRWNERLTTVRADYVVAADGHNSPIRDRLGIGRHGRGPLCDAVGVVFEDKATAERHVMTFDYRPGHGQSVLDFTVDHVTQLVRGELGRPDMAVDVHAVRRWAIGAWVADRFADGRVFLAGDAASVALPTGTANGDTAIGDAYDIAWKLTEVLAGAAGPSLLDSYDVERRPLAERVVLASLYDAKQRLYPELDLTGEPEPPHPLVLEFGVRCRSGAVLADDDRDDTEDPTTPTGRPGFRAPHVPLLLGGEPISTVDLFGDGWTLITGEEGGVWHEATRHVAGELGVRLDSCGLGPQLRDVRGGLATRYGIGDAGASLVRPDGVVAWRGTYEVSDPVATLRGVLCSLLGRADLRSCGPHEGRLTADSA